MRKRAVSVAVNGRFSQKSRRLRPEFARLAYGTRVEIAVLDLGSTTFHLQHMRVDDAGGFVTSLDAKRALCLGTQVFTHGYIDRRSWAECLNAVWELLEASDATGPSQRAIVATSAIRSATNGGDLLREIERTHGAAVRVLQPEEEARLAYLGQSSCEVVGGRRMVAVDLGGGSVEIAAGENTRCVHAVSVPVGAIRMRSRGASAYGRDEARRLAALVREALTTPLRELRALVPEVVLFGSGSARAARRLLMRGSALRGATGPIDAADFQLRLEAHLGCTPEALIALEVDPARADSVLAVATIMLEILNVLGEPHAFVSNRGLRDGVALEVYRARTAPRQPPMAAPARA